MSENESDRLGIEASAALAETAHRLETLLGELARKLRPFPSFLGMVSVQAVEIEPSFRPLRDLGCVVVTPEGQICSLKIATMDGIAGLTEADQVEELQPLDLDHVEYIVYAGAAIVALSEEINRRGG